MTQPNPQSESTSKEAKTSAARKEEEVFDSWEDALDSNDSSDTEDAAGSKEGRGGEGLGEWDEADGHGGIGEMDEARAEADEVTGRLARTTLDDTRSNGVKHHVPNNANITSTSTDNKANTKNDTSTTSTTRLTPPPTVRKPRTPLPFGNPTTLPPWDSITTMDANNNSQKRPEKTTAVVSRMLANDLGRAFRPTADQKRIEREKIEGERRRREEGRRRVVEEERARRSVWED